MTATHGNPVLKFEGVSKIYTMGEVPVKALNSVSLDFFGGELTVLLGASGSGKSTLLNIIGGLDVPTEGRPYFMGKEMTAATEADLTSYRRRCIGFVFQFYNLISSLTALENVQLVTEIYRRGCGDEHAFFKVESRKGQSSYGTALTDTAGKKAGHSSTYDCIGLIRGQRYVRKQVQQ